MIKAGNVISVHSEGGISQITEFGKQLQELVTTETFLYLSKLTSHALPTFPVNQNFIDVYIKKCQSIEGREFLRGHLIGYPKVRPHIGETWFVSMDAVGICAGKWDGSEYDQKQNYYELEPIKPWTDFELNILGLWAAVYFDKEVAYDYAIYPEWAIKIGLGYIVNKIFGKNVYDGPWMGQRTDVVGYRDSSQWKQDCIELTARVINWVSMTRNKRPLFFSGDVNILQPWDLVINPLLRIADSSPMNNPFNKPDLLALQSDFNNRMNLT
jgi:hypothetical protein